MSTHDHAGGSCCNTGAKQAAQVAATDPVRDPVCGMTVDPSTAKGGNISSVVPIVSHADHTEHDTMIFITEQGVADIRGLSPLKRAKLIIEKCAHPDFREQLYDYLKMAQRKNGHEPVDLEHAFDMHIALEKTGTMKEQSKEENHYDYTRRFTA